MNKRIKKKLGKRYEITNEIIRHAVKVVYNYCASKSGLIDDGDAIMIWDWRSDQHDMQYDTVELDGLDTMKSTLITLRPPFKLSQMDKKVLYEYSDNNTSPCNIKASLRAIIDYYDRHDNSKTHFGKSALITIMVYNSKYVLNANFGDIRMEWEK